MLWVLEEDLWNSSCCRLTGGDRNETCPCMQSKTGNMGPTSCLRWGHEHSSFTHAPVWQPGGSAEEAAGPEDSFSSDLQQESVDEASVLLKGYIGFSSKVNKQMMKALYGFIGITIYLLSAMGCACLGGCNGYGDNGNLTPCFLEACFPVAIRTPIRGGVSRCCSTQARNVKAEGLHDSEYHVGAYLRNVVL